MKKDVVICFCPPLSLYPKQPSDQSKCELQDCPQCKKPMWVSEKKKGVMQAAKAFKKEIWLYCYPCSEDKLEKMKASGKILNPNEIHAIKL